MEEENDKLHVISLADDWEVESESGVPLAHEEEKSDAIDTARKLAQQRGIETVILHHGDGVTEKIPAAPTDQTVGIDLPLKALIWEDASGKTWLSYNDPKWIAQRHRARSL